MLYFLYPELIKIFSAFNVLRYLTFRAIMAGVTAFLCSVIFGPKIIKFLKSKKIQDRGKEISLDVTEKHKVKRGTPTMGGIIIIISLMLSIILWADLSNRYVFISILGILFLGAIGFLDDILKVRREDGKGLPGRYKFLLQIIFGVGVGLFLFYFPAKVGDFWNKVILDGNYSVFFNKKLSFILAFPFLKGFFIDLSVFYIFFAALVIVGSSNAVNLTDGLDGLAVGNTIFVGLVYMIFSYVVGNWKLSKYLGLFFVEGSGELTIVCGALIGSCLGFLWFNSYPAEIFMGDTGSLVLGGTIGIISVIIKQEILLLIAGGLFVAETFSVILQVLSYKITGRRIFIISPLHHHFEAKGWAEPKIIVRFWIIGTILILLSLSTLKLR